VKGSRKRAEAPAVVGSSGPPRPDEKRGARAISVSGDVRGIASTGDNPINILVNAVPPKVKPFTEITAPVGLRRLPSRAGLFVGRHNALAVLENEVAGNRDPVVVRVIHGLGGVGKSTLAARYAASCDLNPVWWITADTAANIDTGLAGLAEALQPDLAAECPQAVLRERAMQWLASHDGWLLVLDNVTSPADIQFLISSVQAGRFVVTSRRAAGWHGIASPIVLDVLEPGEAVDLLARIITHGDPRDLDGAGPLCRELGYLPLAIEQVGAYVAEAGITPREYMALLAQAPAAMFAEGAEGTDPERTIARIWRVTLDHLADEPLTGQLLRTLAWYAPDAIPRSLLEPLAEPVSLHRAIRQLAGYSMITVHDGMIGIHRLVQAVARTPDPGDPHRLPHLVGEAQRQAIALLRSALPGADPSSELATWSQWRQILPHIEAVTARSTPDALETAYLLIQTAAFLDSQGATARTVAHFARARGIYHALLGASDPATLACNNNLALAHEAAGNLEAATSLLELTRADAVRELGASHPYTLTTANNLAGAYQRAGNLRQAIPLYRDTLAAREQALGPTHPETLDSLRNLADGYRDAGRLEQAIQLLIRAVREQTQVLGPAHPSTLITRRSLACAYREARDLPTAITLFEQALDDTRRVMGTDHPFTLAVRTELADTYGLAGTPRRAIPMLEQTVTDRERIDGPDNPATLEARGVLAMLRQLAGDYPQAIVDFEQLIADMQRVLGPAHPSTLTTRNNLAATYQAAGDLDRAIRVFERTLADREQALTYDHPATVGSRNNLAQAYQAAGRLDQAIALYERALADAERLVDATHPFTTQIRANLTAARELTSKQQLSSLGRMVGLGNGNFTHRRLGSASARGHRPTSGVRVYP
jgi:tetratricopeptide (TPR) repeat protein